MAGLVPAIHDLSATAYQIVDARHFGRARGVKWLGGFQGALPLPTNLLGTKPLRGLPNGPLAPTLREE
jgi:hypothetical protein